MNHMKKILFALAVVVTLGLVGSSTAMATCSVTAATPALSVRTEGTTELISQLLVACTAAGDVAGVTSSSITVTINGANVAAGAGATTANYYTAGADVAGTGTVSTCGSAATPPNNTSTFPCPGIVYSQAAGLPAAATVTSGASVVFAGMTPVISAGAVTIAIGGIRINAAAGAFVLGSSVLATVSGTAGFAAIPVSVVQVGTIVAGISRTASNWPVGTATFPNNLNILSCAPLRTPSTTTVTPNPDTSGTAFRTLNVVGTGWNAAVAEDATTVLPLAGAGIHFTVPAPGGIQGTRLMITFTGIPNGVTIFMPQSISNIAPNASTAPGTGGTGSLVGAGSRMTLIGGNSADGSGGGAQADIKDQFDAIPSTGGTALAVYEVMQGAPTAVNIVIEFTGIAPTDVSIINVTAGLGPVGPTTLAAARPQFAAAPAGIEIAETRACVTNLLFPWVVNTNDGNYDTGIAINNASSDPLTGLKIPGIRGAVPTPGKVTLYFYPTAGGTAPAPLPLTPSPLPAGQTATFIASSLKTAFTGYVIAVCEFAWGHGFAFINNPIGGQNGFAQGYTANVLPNNRNVVPESVGQ